MSYKSKKAQLLLTVKPNWVKKEEHRSGRQMMALCRYLQTVSAIHSVVRYNALWAYLKRNYPMQQFPLSFEILQTITDDLEMRRNQTKVLIAEYAEWSKDPYAYIFYKGCIPKNIRIRVFKQYTERIEMLWPTEKGKWPHNPNSIL